MTSAKASSLRSSMKGRKYFLLLLLQGLLVTGLMMLRGPALPSSSDTSNEALLTNLHEIVSILNKTLQEHFVKEATISKNDNDNRESLVSVRLKTNQLQQQVDELKLQVSGLKTKAREQTSGTAAASTTNNVTASSFERDFQAARQDTLQKFPTHSLFGFYQSVYKQPKASLEVYKGIRLYMPESPIYMVSSAGYHYDPLAERHPSHVRYTYDHVNAATWVPQNRPDGIDRVNNLQRWLDHFFVAAVWCNCDYLVFMEDDTLLRKPLTEKPPHDAGGMHQGGFRWSQELQDRFGAANWSYRSHGMCGGSYLRVEAFLHVYNNINWTRIGEMKEIDVRIGRHSDVTLALLMMDAGYILKPFQNVTSQKYSRDVATATLLHAEKKYYDKPLQPHRDGAVISDVLKNESKSTER